MAAKRPRKEDRERQRALDDLAAIAREFFMDTTGAQRIIDEEWEITGRSAILESMVFHKKTGTLLKRIGALRMYGKWLATTEFETADFASERAVYSYFSALHQDSAPATRAQSLREALNFAEGIFGLSAKEVRSSSRIHGISCKLLRTRAEVRQSVPLSTTMVKVLEEILAKGCRVPTADAILAGDDLFAMYGRARVGDVRRCAHEPKLDLALLADEHVGYVETRFFEHKTARPGSRKSLPIAAPAYGLLGTCWAEQWLSARRAAGLSADEDGTLLQALGEDEKWLQVSYTTTEFATVLRSLLARGGVEQAALAGVGSHSLKATLLAWCAKYGLPRESRRVLGYHAVPGDRAMGSYARDALAGPLREFDVVLQAVRAGRFDPDATRSGAFTAAPASDPADPKDDLIEKGDVGADVVVDSPSESETSSSEKSDIVDDTSQDSDAVNVAEADEKEVVFNLATHVCHIKRDDKRLVCGKVYPTEFVMLTHPESGMRLCPRCF